MPQQLKEVHSNFRSRKLSIGTQFGRTIVVEVLIHKNIGGLYLRQYAHQHGKRYCRKRGIEFHGASILNERS